MDERTPAVSAARTNSVIEGRVRSSDDIEIAYSARGSGGTSLVLIHGGLADRSFWAPQLSSLADDFQVVALDLAGHGASGHVRTAWTIAAFAEDVRAVVETLNLRRVVLIGNSLGGPVALEAARLLRGRVLGVVGVDTFHDATVTLDPAESRRRAAAVREDFRGACRAMVQSLFHPGTQRELQAWAEQRMSAMSPEVVAGLMEGFGGYDLCAAFRGAGVPIRALNGDLWPTDIERNRTVVPDFDAVIMKGAGHYPMLERPVEFSRLLVEVVGTLAHSASGTSVA
jgi:pimeloyl-ACP methyl ester carboxylesterase